MSERWTTRRTFIGTGTGMAAAALWPSGAASGRGRQDPYERPAPLGAELAQQIVGASHGRIEVVRDLLARHPALANAAWDWGGGDWETALGAAAHTGRREIAALLLDHGARMDLFAAAMLGHLDVVTAALAAQPDLDRVLGPHMLCLWWHARAGREGAADVLALLEARGALRDEPIDEASREARVGRYVDGETAFDVVSANRRLLLRRDGGPAAYLLNQGGGEFRAGTTLDVPLRFESVGGEMRLLVGEGAARRVARRG